MGYSNCKRKRKRRCSIFECNKCGILKCFGIIGSIVLLFYLYNFISIGLAFHSLKRDLGRGRCGSYNAESKERMQQQLADSRRGRNKAIIPIDPAVYGLVKEALKEYSADKTGRTDFALESMGGKVASIVGTELYAPNRKTIFGIPVCHGSSGAGAMLRPDMQPGNCWAFKGSRGSAIIKLLGHVFVDSVSLEHISKNISPTKQIDTAPKRFSIWGLDDENDSRGVRFGDFKYDADGPTLQTFQVECSGKSYQYIKFNVHSNHGNPTFTCVYRLRVHGVLDKSAEKC